MNMALWAADWKDVPKGQQRLESATLETSALEASALEESKATQDDSTTEKTDAALTNALKAVEQEIERQKALDIKNGIYSPGMGEISGAFGIKFEDELPKSTIIRHLGWNEISSLPEGLTFTVVDTVLDLPTFHIKPPAIPGLFANKNIVYRAFLDFEGQPLWVQAKGIPNIKEVKTVLKRKYGEPDSESNQGILFYRGGKALHFSHKRNRGTLDYYDVDAFQKYLNRRQTSLSKKNKEHNRLRLSETEQKIFTIAEQLRLLRQSSGAVFGIDFKQRIGFLAKPDEYVDLVDPVPFKGITGGAYKIMVSPDLMPIILRYEVGGSKLEMRQLKVIFDQALKLEYGGFLKKTSKHSVISFRDISISVLIRSGKLSFSVLNSKENKLYNKRVKKKLLAEREAEAFRLKTIADLKQKKLDEIVRLKREKEQALARQIRKKEQALARQMRKNEISEENGF